MDIHSLVLQGFTKHKSTTVEFPDNGIVLVTGGNGAGKSSLIEGVAYAGWGETLRGTLPGGRKAVECQAALRFTAGKPLFASRSRKQDKSKFEWFAEGQPRSEWPTASKAQEALEVITGPFELWRRTHVFSSTDAAHFTLSTDKERKVFLEQLFGLGRFDEALERCRTELRFAEREFNDVNFEVQSKKNVVVQAKQRIVDAERQLTAFGDISPALDASPETVALLEESAKKLRDHIRKAEREIAGLQAEIASVSADTGGAERELAMLARRLQKLGETGSCDSCGQIVPEELRKGLKLGIEKIKAGVTAEQAKAKEASADFRAEAADVEETLAKLRAKERQLLSELDSVKRAAQERMNARRARKTAEEMLNESRKALVEAETALETTLARGIEAQKQLTIGQAAELALGLRGARVGILAKMLGSLEDAANVWLPRLAGKGLRVELKPYSEKKSGGVSDAIGLDILGAGGGEGYRAASGGERRRLDVALLLAFAGRGTLFFDEVFDALDSEGIGAVVEVLGELAKDRCVVVITHSEELAARIPCAKHWAVADGVLS